ncbi:MAG TPA: hypothetical protein VN631_17850 [Negativicutes bacterium]|nr:hypothetical protein [Negativicutes bacterium]
MRKKLLNNNLTGAISKGGVLYRPGEIPTLTKEQITQANLVSKLPRDFPFANWENMTARQQQQTISRSGLNSQDQWALLNSNVPLTALHEHNQAQNQSDSTAIAGRVAASLTNATAQAAVSAKVQAAVGKPAVSTPLQTTAQQRKSDMKQEEYETRFYEKQARRPIVVYTPNDTTKTLVGGKPIFDSRDAIEKKKDSVWDKIAVPTWRDKREDEIWGQVNGKPLTYPVKPGSTPLPQPGASPIIPGVTPTPYPANAEYAYVFYTDNPGAEFSEQAKYQKQILEKQGYKVKLICTNSATAFSNAWNNMDPKTGAAVIISHSNGMSLLFQEGTKTNAIGATGRTINDKASLMKISDLKGPELGLVYILACNAGHQELLKYVGTNVADAFRDLPNVDKVYAYDGSVGFGIPIISSDLAPRLALDQNGYYAVFDNFDIPNEHGNPSGQILYDDEN